MHNELGLREEDMNEIVSVITGLSSIRRAVVFGSRAKGNYHSGSDVDIAVWSLNDDAVLKLSGLLNDETLMPYKFDVLNYDTIDNMNLKDHIDRLGVEIYRC